MVVAVRHDGRGPHVAAVCSLRLAASLQERLRRSLHTRRIEACHDLLGAFFRLVDPFAALFFRAFFWSARPTTTLYGQVKHGLDDVASNLATEAANL